MANQGISRKWVEVLKSMYNNATAYVRTDVKGKTFEIRRGIRQGDPLLPNLFNNCILEEIFSKLNWEGKGVHIDGKYPK